MTLSSGDGAPFLLHLNGPAGVGKSTVAAAIVADLPLALCIDIDVVRTRIGRWVEQPESKRLAREVGEGPWRGRRIFTPDRRGRKA